MVRARPIADLAVVEVGGFDVSRRGNPPVSRKDQKDEMGSLLPAFATPSEEAFRMLELIRLAFENLPEEKVVDHRLIANGRDLAQRFRQRQHLVHAHESVSSPTLGAD